MFCLIPILLLVAVSALDTQPAYGGQLEQLAATLGPQDALSVTTGDEHTLLAVHADQPMVPASILKILTAATALHYLGSDYRFKTEFYQTRQNDLIIAGRGDPMLVSEEVATICRRLSSRLSAVGDIIADGSYFSSPIQVPGVSRSLNPYDATNGALCVNFNTVKFKTVNGKLVSDEPQTPLLPIVVERIRHQGLRQGRIVFAQDNRDNTRYAGHLFAYFLKEAGVPFAGSIRLGTTPTDARNIYTHLSSRPLPAVITALMTYSNNFIANQIVLVLGAENMGAPATLEKGIEVVRNYARDKLGLGEFEIAEGSGISRRNRLTARQMDRILAAFEPQRHLLKGSGRAAYKTGTLLGIRTRAGYIEGNAGQTYRFVIMLNNSHADPDKIITRLQSALP
jgi:D-alanyl-D-alanine carboxypeptidase/D-alanyl-D-alanine-endopeptidase (penicillin-binding protein 4)